ncbi:MAG: dimethylmenaquinone methyltransferase [Acidobacteria bacterium]|nr:MAG: dimethylmenaquinone methyltransferase [Acidobacteriota bacterium]
MSKMRDTVLSFAIMFLVWAPTARAQLGTFSGEQRIQFTPDWHGDRFADGRPRVPESVLVRLHQFESGWKVINPGHRLVGRVVTAVFLPHRPDVDSVIQTNGKKEARVGGENSWVIDILQPGDVLVVDLFGKIRYGTFAGDNLSTSIYAKSHNGLIVNGAVRDVSGIQQIKGFQCYVRGVDPSALENTMLMGINTPIRIGDVTVMPGDVALGDPEGVTFIPAQLAEKVADDTEMIHRVDEWGHAMLREGRYTPGQIDRKWSREMVDEFNQWLKQKGSKLRMPLP